MEIGGTHMALQGTLITELDTFTGNTTDTTYLLIDNGSATYKIDANSLVGVLELSVESVDTLPQTISNAKITADMKAIHSILSNPSAQASDWTVTTSAGSVVISGTINGTTDITIYLAVPRI